MPRKKKQNTHTNTLSKVNRKKTGEEGGKESKEGRREGGELSIYAF